MNKSVRFGSVRLPRWWVQVGGVAMVGLLSFACSSDADVPSAQGGAAGGGGKAGNGGGGKAGTAAGGSAGQSSSEGGAGQGTNGGTGNVGNGGTSGNSSTAGGPSGGSGGTSTAGGPSGGIGGTSTAGGPSGGIGGTSTAGGPSGGIGGTSTAGGPSGGIGGTSTAGGPSGGIGGTSTAGGPSGGSGGNNSSTAGGPSGGSGGVAQGGSGGAQGGAGGAQGGSGGAAPTAFLKWQNGYVDGPSNTGSVQGYWYTFSGGSGSVISESPAFATAGASICVFGSAAQQTGGSGSTVGFNTNQIAGIGTPANAWNATSHSVAGIEFVLTGSQVPATIQIDVRVKDSPNAYCLLRTSVTSGGAQTIPFAAVQQDCRTSGGSHPAPDATKIEAIHFQIPTSATSSTGFNFCVTSIKLL